MRKNDLKEYILSLDNRNKNIKELNKIKSNETTIFDIKLNKIYKKASDNFTINDLIFGDLKTLLRIRNEIGDFQSYKRKTSYYAKRNINFKFKEDPFLNLYINFSKSEFGHKFKSYWDNKTCPYCQTAYIISFYKQGELYNTATYDHKIPKGRYPYLALSLENIIPVCHVCNVGLKGQSDTSEEFEVSKLIGYFYINFSTDEAELEVSKRKLREDEFEICFYHSNQLEKKWIHEVLFLKERYNCFRKEIAVFIHTYFLTKKDNYKRESAKTLFNMDYVSDEFIKVMEILISYHISNSIKLMSKLRNDILSQLVQ